MPIRLQKYLCKYISAEDRLQMFLCRRVWVRLWNGTDWNGERESA